jgi:hypothetical protein
MYHVVGISNKSIYYLDLTPVTYVAPKSVLKKYQDYDSSIHL